MFLVYFIDRYVFKYFQVLYSGAGVRIVDYGRIFRCWCDMV